MEKNIHLIEYAKHEGFTDSLALRPVAKVIYAQVIKSISDVEVDDTISCFFTGIEICDVSFADEFIINLQKKVLSVDNAVMRIVDASEYVSENIEAAVSLRGRKDRSKICLLQYFDGVYSIIGELEKNLEEVFFTLTKNLQITAREVAQLFNLEINSASNRLKKLFDLRLTKRKETIDETGRYHVYFLP